MVRKNKLRSGPARVADKNIEKLTAEVRTVVSTIKWYDETIAEMEQCQGGLQ